ncbi:hypothetical protein HG536_0A02260 [Torulaspora globosa]|uniref:U3 small nucleolar RNA-associated protein 25 n=1 Tax=Torulaspora globosa TaxID=48254 RepID=A0A7G3ZA73_9SACH|nr:uncharacterized protein HG536_0A02260 [Torulaspora globosa]QLL30409.1 hypothetical protein HG536_0A02260 [Torulaspora globosa]
MVGSEREGERTRKNGFSKRGRKDLRSIRRAQRNEPRNGSNGSEEAIEAVHSPQEVQTGAPKHLSDVDEEADDEMSKRRKVYGALLTILKSEHPSTERESRREKVNAVAVAESEEEENQENEVEQLEEQLLNVEADPSDDELDGPVDDSEDEHDPFESHFNQVPEKLIDEMDAAFKQKTVSYKSAKIPIGDNRTWIYSKPVLPDRKDEKLEKPTGHGSLHQYAIKQRLKIQNDLDTAELTALQKILVDPMFQYNDLLYEYESYEKDEEDYRDLYALHVLNHVYKTRDRILKNNQRISENADAEYSDQGFTRPKVLIVVPTRDSAYQVVSKIVAKSGVDQVDKKSKFQDQFFEDSVPPASKPKSFQHIFKGNTNDFFVLGMKFTRKAIKLYSNFYQSDIIICSPLGIHLILENTDKKKRQDDFLSSVEITIIDQLHSIEYQNISHVLTIFDHLNKIPREQHDTDFGRVRLWYINEQAKLFRQTMIFTKYVSPTANALINNRCQNISGRWKNHRMIEPTGSSIGKLGLKVRQIFQRIDMGSASVIEEPDLRFKFFTSVIIPSIVKSTGYEDGILIYIPDYADFLRVRNHLKEKTTVLFGDINEYSDQRQLNSNRALFQQGRVKVLLYTERLHHFRRYEIKGAKSIVFYQPPGNSEFYGEVVRFLAKSALLGTADLNISTVRTIYSKLDGLRLERIVGTKRAAVLTRGQNEVYEFK